MPHSTDFEREGLSGSGFFAGYDGQALVFRIKMTSLRHLRVVLEACHRNVLCGTLPGSGRGALAELNRYWGWMRARGSVEHA